MRPFLRSWDAFFFRPFDPLPAALFRISLGILILASLLANLPNWETYYAPDGIPGLRDQTLGQPTRQWWSVFYWTQDTVPVTAFWWIAVGAAISYTIGFRSKLSALILFLIVTAMLHRNPLASNAEDTTFRMYLFYSFLLPIGETLSWDAWRRKRRENGEGTPNPQPAIWPARIVQFHVLLVYLLSAPLKVLSDESWWTGDALYYVMVNPLWGRWPWPEFFYIGIVAQAATYGSLLLEVAFPFFVWVPRFRPYLTLAMFGFHLLMAIALKHIAFFALSFACGLWLFLEGQEIRNGWIRLLERLRKFRAMVLTSPHAVKPSG